MAQVNSEPGVPYGGSLLNVPAVTAQVSTQTNPGFPSYGINSIVQAEQRLAVTPFTYSAAGSRSAV
jgi:hypothetical protein